MDQEFFERDAVTVAKDLVGKVLVRGDKRLRISFGTLKSTDS